MAWANQYRRSDESRRAILDAALAQCREVGYESVSIEAVARRAGAGKQTIYRWWPSKGVLLLDAVVSLGSDSESFPDTGDVVADLTAQMTRAARTMSSPTIGPVLFGLLGAAHHDTALAERLDRDLLGPRREACVARLRAARERGELAADVDETLLMEQLYGLLYYRSLVIRKPPTSAYVRRHVAGLLGGHAGRPRARRKD
ncbi:TetR/AcrR family transcriptional regulator [Amycolatopsis acidiphila]|uniref:TetR/AcrR family transcriptional regulator n=1 Tax=Amycolatopsis acidiphila TaxID=715473 RepID=A0A558A6E3_9PSEU|nr:TetR/AcrR family transcriptional regulator [Amycolatopsis acidiphila]TVT19839.1 TetR/AcrR family transcriptional regulator [Amycolatopsis acidiphila]UIJ58745.1 TetR/AcrR family transcriptional regulator [Amycolatopsis acidiphila]GHG71688.1 TetR family transcriptional regulator [Amycolatopsis acidiphila]